MKHPWITGKSKDSIPLTNIEMFSGFRMQEKLINVKLLSQTDKIR